jgi:hypothetical protein
VNADRILAPFKALVEALTARMDWHALYPCKVLLQHADKTVDLQPESRRIPGQNNVPVRSTPGITSILSSNARVLLGFENGDPRAPFALLCDNGVATTPLPTIIFNGGANAVAVKGTAVDCGTLIFTPNVGAMSPAALAYSAPGVALVPPMAVPPMVYIPLSGLINDSGILVKA